MKRIILHDDKKDNNVSLKVRMANCDFCREQDKECVNNNDSVDMCWDCINQLATQGKKK